MPKFGERRTDVNRFVRWSMSHEQSSLVRRSMPHEQSSKTSRPPTPGSFARGTRFTSLVPPFTLRGPRPPTPDPRSPVSLPPQRNHGIH